jgi:hypothetical protein
VAKSLAARRPADRTHYHSGIFFSLVANFGVCRLLSPRPSIQAKKKDCYFNRLPTQKSDEGESVACKRTLFFS